MTKNIWIARVAAVVFQGLSSLLIVPVPETAPWPASAGSTAGVEYDILSTSVAENKNHSTFKKSLRNLFFSISNTLAFVTKVPAVAALVFMFLISKIGRQIHEHPIPVRKLSS